MSVTNDMCIELISGVEKLPRSSLEGFLNRVLSVEASKFASTKAISLVHCSHQEEIFFIYDHEHKRGAA